MAPDRQYCVETKGSKSPYSYSSILESLRPNLAEKKKEKKKERIIATYFLQTIQTTRNV